MPKLCIRLFGRFAIASDGKVLDGFDGKKIQELLCYLLLYRDQPHPRETLAGIVWGDLPSAQSKKALRNALWHIQSALHIDAVTLEQQLWHIESDWIQIQPDTAFWLDVSAFDQVFRRVRSTRGRDLSPELVKQVEDAVELYSGELLTGWYQEWCLAERERLRDAYLLMRDKLVGYCEAHQLYEAALIHAEQILRFDRTRERTHQRLMRLHYRAGFRDAALRQYAHCAAALAEELAVKPSRATVELYEQIRADRLDEPAVAFQPNSSPIPTTLIPELLAQLRQLQSHLTVLETQVQSDIHAVERILRRPR
jgi:DNA-binding SARP family transcriptional activator